MKKSKQTKSGAHKGRNYSSKKKRSAADSELEDLERTTREFIEDEERWLREKPEKIKRETQATDERAEFALRPETIRRFQDDPSWLVRALRLWMAEAHHRVSWWAFGMHVTHFDELCASLTALADHLGVFFDHSVERFREYSTKIIFLTSDEECGNQESVFRMSELQRSAKINIKRLYVLLASKHQVGGQVDGPDDFNGDYFWINGEAKYIGLPPRQVALLRFIWSVARGSETPINVSDITRIVWHDRSMKWKEIKTTFSKLANKLQPLPIDYCYSKRNGYDIVDVNISISVEPQG